MDVFITRNRMCRCCVIGVECCWKFSDSLSVSMGMEEWGVDTSRSHQSLPLTNANSNSKIRDIAHCGPAYKISQSILLFFDRVLKLRNWTAKWHYSNRHKAPKQQKLMDKYLKFSGYRGDIKLYICVKYISLVWWIPENLTSPRVVWFGHTQMNRMSPTLFLIVDC